MSSSFPGSSAPPEALTNPAKGKLKIYLGYAAGVGKTYQMLEEAHALVLGAVDVVVGYFEPHDRPDTTALLAGLVTVPCRPIEYRGIRFSEMDSDAIVRRHPHVVLVDEFPHSNVPGLERAKRWEDVLYLLENGIDVWTTMNVQHLESLNDDVYQMSGVRIRETIPDWVVQQASEVVMVDLAPRALLNRLDRGAIYHGEKAESAKRNFFKETTLAGLREFALRETAFEVESRHNPAEKSEPKAQPELVEKVDAREPAAVERVLVLLTSDPSTAALVRRGKRVADYLKADCIAVVICPKGDLSLLPAAERQAMEKHLKFARNLHVRAQVLKGDDVARELAAFAHQNGVTQIYLSRQKKEWLLPFRRGLIHRIIRLAGDIEITVVAHRAP